LRTGKSSTNTAAFFTPNGRRNDYWNLEGLNGSIYKTRKYSFSIGWLLIKQLNPYGVGWDGNYNGNSLPRTITGIQLQLKDGRKQRPFSLKEITFNLKIKP
jgi:gliding motility-associated-like protein